MKTFLPVASVVVALFIGFVIGTNDAQSKIDPLDVNRDGEANLVDLSVLAAQLNARGQK